MWSRRLWKIVEEYQWLAISSANVYDPFYFCCDTHIVDFISSKAHFQRALSSASHVANTEPTQTPSETNEQLAAQPKIKKTHPCPHPGCSNQYKQLSGLRYHLTHVKFVHRWSVSKTEKSLFGRDIPILVTYQLNSMLCRLHWLEKWQRSCRHVAHQQVHNFMCGIGNLL